MKILSIDTSSKRCSVTILDDSKVLINLCNDDEKTHSVKLMPMVDQAFKDTNLNLDDIALLACSVGPGSFTGVRIGIATVKAFADVKNIPVVGISSLESLAYNLHINNDNSLANFVLNRLSNSTKISSDKTNYEIHNSISDNQLIHNTLTCSLIDAKHENVYCGLYKFSSNGCELISMLAENI